MLQRSKDDSAIEKFLDYFYKFCIDILFQLLSDVPLFGPATLRRWGYTRLLDAAEEN